MMSRFLTFLVLGLFAFVLLASSETREQQNSKLLAAEKGREQRPVSVTLIPPSPQTDRIRASLDEQTEVQFIDTPLKDVAEFLSNLHDINILIDRAALEEEGVATDEPITLSLSKVRLRSALNLILEQHGLTYLIEDEVLKITTEVVAEDKYETRIYDVRILDEADFDSEVLARMITRTINVGGWHSTVSSVEVSVNGKTVALKAGEQTIQLWDVKTGKPKGDRLGGDAAIETLSGWLIIRQTQSAHRKIFDLLTTLERLAKS